MTGQWVWSRDDLTIYARSKAALPDLVPCIWVSTLKASKGKIVQQLALDPNQLKATAGGIGLVIRLDDSLHALWDARKAEDMGEEIDAALGRLMKIINRDGIEVREVQLDYDCPVRQLGAWAGALGVISRNSLKGRDVWITSLPAHLGDKDFGKLFRGVVKGHIVQLFDTGMRFDKDTLKKLTKGLSTQDFAFRVGLGAFERLKYKSERTAHRLWFSALGEFSSINGYSGIMVFPGGRKWVSLLNS